MHPANTFSYTVTLESIEYIKKILCSCEVDSYGNWYIIRKGRNGKPWVLNMIKNLWQLNDQFPRQSQVFLCSGPSLGSSVNWIWSENRLRYGLLFFQNKFLLRNPNTLSYSLSCFVNVKFTLGFIIHKL